MKRPKKKKLEMKLEGVLPYHDPTSELEQYTTPAPIAADMLFGAYSQGDILDRRVADLGCGTGIFALGSALLGATQVYGIDLDEKAVQRASKKAQEWDVEKKIELFQGDVETFDKKVDTVMMNPPFGAQKKGADVPFLEKAMDISPVVYSLHNKKSEDFVRDFIEERDYKIFWEKNYMFEVPNIYRFHQKKSEEFEVILFAYSE